MEEARAADALAPLLPLLLRVAREPEAALLASGAAPLDAARAMTALRAALRGAEEAAARHAAARAAALREAREAAARRDALAGAEAEAREAGRALDAELQGARARRVAATAAEAQAVRRAEELTARARSLDEAVQRLERRPAALPRAAPQPPLPAPRGEEEGRDDAAGPGVAQLGVAHPGVAHPGAARPGAAHPGAAHPGAARPWPVAGPVVRAFGAPGEGGASRGITLAAQPGARVVSPCGGRVAFAGPFRSYGRVVIVECGADHAVLAGLARLDTSTGDRVLAGEPLGSLPLVAGSGTPGATLYMEVRRGGEPTDPRPWLRP